MSASDTPETVRKRLADFAELDAAAARAHATASDTPTRPDKVSVLWLQCLGLSKKHAGAVVATHNEQMSAKERSCAELRKALEETCATLECIAKGKGKNGYIFSYGQLQVMAENELVGARTALRSHPASTTEMGEKL